MKKFLVFICLIILTGLLAYDAAPARAANVTFTLLNDLPTHLEVGESYTIAVEVVSDDPFLLAMALPSAYYPGRGVFFNDSDRVTHATSAVLQVTVTGKNSTANLPGGVAPLSLVVGTRYAGGGIISEQFNFAVAVP
jgi:hypothetical protein